MMLFQESHSPKPLLLVFPFGLLSHYLRCIVLANQFRSYFDVLIARSDRYQDFIEKEGFNTFDCRDIEADKVMECVRKFDFSWINKGSLERVYQDQVEVLKQYKPVAVLGDTSPTLKMAAEKTGVTYLSLQNGYMTKYYQYTRKISRTHPGSKYLKTLPSGIVGRLTQFGEALSFYKIHQPFKKIRQQEGLSEKKNYQDELEGDINLVCDLPELFPLKRLPANYKLIQPLFYEGGNISSKTEINHERGKKTIFVSMGSTGDWSQLSFLNHEYFRKFNLVTAGDKESVLNGPHVIKLDFANAKDVFPFTDLVICHGGNGTIYQALSYGIPLLCKTAHFEQEWNVDALERIHAGQSLDNVSDLAEYMSVVDKWITKKEKGALSSFRNLISNRQQLGELAVHEVSRKILGGRVLWEV
jgi:UDP:flavonoid glycosyltransferase YjiC (YdhE family)